MNNYYYFPLPPSLNQMYKISKTGHFYKTSLAKKVQIDFIKLVKMVYGIEKLKGRVQLNIISTYHNKKINDLDNYLKILFDGLKNNAFGDDSTIYNFEMDKLISQEIKPGLYVKISPYVDIQAKLLNICKNATTY